MENAARFLTSIAVIVVAAVIFNFAQAKEINFGSVADWAGAIANFGAVSVALWFSLHEQRERAKAEVQSRRKARENLLRSIDDLLRLSRHVFEAYGNGAFPSLPERKRFKYELQAAIRVWERVEVPWLSDYNQSVIADADGPFNELFQAIAVIIAQDQLNEVVAQQFTPIISASGELFGLRRALN